MSTTKQVSQTKNVPNPSGKGGFGDNPQNRSDGGWKKEDSISYQYNMLMRLHPDELSNFEPQTVAQSIALKRIQAANHKTQGLSDTKEITDRTEGKAPQSIDVTTGGEKLNIALVEFVDGNNQDEDSTTDGV